ncbi:MAG: ABC transporter substrate-binding protein [Cyanobacteria bacterium SZAS-4]|nr:ABC transporter substrate-binding protein [Cyanobacteria bacterium SZAS-4]
MNLKRRQRFQALTVTLSTLLIASTLSGCGADKVPSTTGSTTTTTTTTTTETSADKGPLAIVSPPNPGPYKTKLIEGEEMRVGRFPVGQVGGTLVRSMVGTDPKTFNYWAAEDTGSTLLASHLFSGLVTIDPWTGDVIPDMAESFKVDPDGVTYTTKLRKGLPWSDGKPITSADVAFTWNKLIAGGYGNASLRDVVSVDGKLPTVTAVDELTNKFVTPKPFAPFLRQIGIAIAPQHVIEPILQRKDGRSAFQQLWSSNIDPKTLVTSGPYTLARFVPAQRVELQATKNYYMVNSDGKKLPYLEKLMFLIVPDPNTNLLKFIGKEIDLTVVRARDIPKLLTEQEKGDFKLYNLGPSIGTTFVMMNMNRRDNEKTHKPFVSPIKSKWFNDTNFRQAINHSINRQEIVDNYFKGIGSTLFTAEPSASPYFNSKLQPFKTDNELSMSLLKKSGFEKKPDGFLYDKDGNKVVINMLTSAGSTFYEFIGNMMVNDMKKLGITVNFQPIAFNVLNDKVTSGDWECCLMSLSPGDALEPNDGANVWKSNGRMHMFDERQPDASGNIVVKDARPWEKKLDELFSKGAQTLDKAERHKIYDEYQQIAYDEAPFIYLVTPATIVAARNSLQNYVPTTLSQYTSGIHNIEEVWKKGE